MKILFDCPATLTIDSDEHAPKLLEWLAKREGIAVWKNRDLGSSSLGHEQFTPALQEDGTPVPSPHWSCGHTPDRIVTDRACVTIREWQDVAICKVRSGPPYLGGIHRLDRDKLDTALEKAGEGASWRPDWDSHQYGSAWFTAIISIPGESRPL